MRRRHPLCSYALYCACRLAELASFFEPEVAFVSIDLADPELDDLGTRYEIMSLPTFLLFREGSLEHRLAVHPTQPRAARPLARLLTAWLDGWAGRGGEQRQRRAGEQERRRGGEERGEVGGGGRRWGRTRGGSR